MNSRIPLSRIGLALLDAMMITLSLFAAYRLRLLDITVAPDYGHQFIAVLPLFLFVRLLLLWLFNLYRGIIRYASTGELLAIVMATALGSAILALANAVIVPLIPVSSALAVHAERRVPILVLILEGLMTLLLVGGARFSRRLLVSGYLWRRSSNGLRRVVIVGAGDAGEAVARQMLHGPTSTFYPVAFVDDDAGKKGLRIHGVPVAGNLTELPRVIADFAAEEVLVAMKAITPTRIREIVDLCQHARVGYRILPHVQDVLTGRVSISQIRPVEIEDLLGRDPIRLELAAERNYVRDQVVIITGAGGSIGSELCRQILSLEPRRLVLFGHGENSIYEIAQELSTLPEVMAKGKEFLVPLIGEIRDQVKVADVFRMYRPGIVFHAAAHKHVPLMELHPDEAVKNNVTGTLNVARAADENGARKFVLISTDKAVRPTNVMGATKRVAEMMVFCLARQSKTQYVAVRFGNVLGSRGSVVPLFKRQIARGGPVTLTHPEITRFFMTIPEAVSLVIQAGSMPEQGRLYLLDMGESVKIADLARNLIRLSGFDPETDIEIRYTGLRPGEKLKEELLTAGENIHATELGKIFRAEPEQVDCDWLWQQVTQLQSAAAALDLEAIRTRLRQIVPDYGPEAESS